MNFTLRRRLLLLFPLAFCFRAAWAEAVVTLVVPYPAGGAGDNMARAVAPGLEKQLQRSVVIDNVSGATGSIGAGRALAAPADGSVILVGSPTETVLAPLALRAAGYQAEDFRLVGVLSTAPLALYARADLAADSFGDLIALSGVARAHDLSFGSTGIGSLFHIVGAKLFAAAHIPVIHVPYRGGAPLLQNLVGGSLDLAVLPVDGTVAKLVEGGRVKALVVLAPQRHPRFPQVQSLVESTTLDGFEVHEVWAGLLVHRKTPEPVVEHLHNAMLRALQSPEVRSPLEAAGGAIPAPMSLAEAGAFYSSEMSLLRKLAQSAGIVPE